jgi:CheY-like chemotaxis protein
VSEIDTTIDRTASVLVVEDNEASATGYAEILTGQGYRVQFAKDGYEVLAQLNQSRPDVVVLDLKIPKMDGWEVLERLKSMSTTPPIHVVVVTGDPLPSHHELAMGRGASAVLVKPITAPDLLAAVRDALAANVSPAAAT